MYESFLQLREVLFEYSLRGSLVTFILDETEAFPELDVLIEGLTQL